MENTTTSEQQTRDIGKHIASQLKAGDIVLLCGDLGAGKTTLTQGIAAGLGVEKYVTSPTFGLMNVYEIKKQGRPEAGPPLVENKEIKKLVHIDTYRLKSQEELVAIGAEDYLGGQDTVCIIEWPEKIEGLLAGKKVKKIFLEHLGEEKRKITFENS